MTRVSTVPTIPYTILSGRKIMKSVLKVFYTKIYSILFKTNDGIPEIKMQLQIIIFKTKMNKNILHFSINVLHVFVNIIMLHVTLTYVIIGENCFNKFF